MDKTRRALTQALPLAALLPGLGHAQSSYPNKPIRLLVGFAAGGGSDIAARILVERLTGELGQSIVVENRPGAGGTIGDAQGARAAPDGYTLLMTANGPHVIAPNLYTNLHYDIFKDFESVSMVATSPYVLMVHPSVPVKTVPELIEWLKKQPKPAAYASAGNGTPAHLAAELFKSMAHVDMLHVPYKGSAPALTDLIAGNVSVLFSDMPVAAPHLKGTSVRALAVTSSTRSPLQPDLPTVAEAALPGFEAVSWYGVLAPAGTPKADVELLNARIVKVLAIPEVQDKYAALGSSAKSSTPAEFDALIRRDYEKWGRVIKDAGITVEPI
jgi:tripartite-type tricarboxylate transporter receptor subunit TctC